MFIISADSTNQKCSFILSSDSSWSPMWCLSILPFIHSDTAVFVCDYVCDNRANNWQLSLWYLWLSLFKKKNVDTKHEFYVPADFNSVQFLLFFLQSSMLPLISFIYSCIWVFLSVSLSAIIQMHNVCRCLVCWFHLSDQPARPGLIKFDFCM